jgi:threonine aldolase
MNLSELRFAPSLGSDNHSGVHPKIFEALTSVNRGFAHAYGLDEVSDLTQKEFERVFGPKVKAEYVFTGTAANVLSLAPLLKSYESIIASDCSHLHLDECGAPEKFLGAKIWTLPSPDGRIRPEQAEALLERRGDQHHSQPRAISLTLPNEFGVCYRLDELKRWGEFARRNRLYLHIDGARLPNAAVFLKTSLAALTSEIGADVVSFGGTKNGLLGAEAVLLLSDAAKDGFKFYRKQGLQLSSKTRFLAAQFYAYLACDLWREIATHAHASALKLAEDLKEFPEIEIVYPVESNALFVKLPKEWIKPLRERFFFYIWDAEKCICRWMVSWNWTDELARELLTALREVKTCSQRK